MPSLRILYSVLLVVSLSPPSDQLGRQTKETLRSPHRRDRRDAGESARIQGENDCPGCSTPGVSSYTPHFSGQCFMCPVGTPGPRGPPGQQGIPGRDGRDGRDASPTVGAESGNAESDTSCADTQPRPSIATPTGGGVIYVRWGRDVCPESSSIVYSGVVGGAHYTHKGSGSNHLCLPKEPIYDNPVAGSSGQDRGFLYGAEYETDTFAEFSHLHQNDVPCAVCSAPSRLSLLMVPARNVCPEGGSWVKEYSGYLVSAYYNHEGRTEFICMDRDPQAIPRSVHNSNGLLFYPVEGRCGSSGSGLPCGPYVDGYELTCAVCTM